MLNKVEGFIKSVGKETNILAVKMLVNRKIAPTERIIWFLVMLALSQWALYLSHVQLTRFYESAFVVAVDRDDCNWESAMPAITICYNPELNETALDEFIMERWNITSNNSDYFSYVTFVSTLINVRLTNLQYLSKFENFNETDLYEIFKKLTSTHEHSAYSFNADHKVKIHETISEIGFCYTFNSVINLMLTDRIDNIFPRNATEVLNCTFCRQDCFLQIGIYDGFGSIIVHSPYELPDYDAKAIKFKPYEDIKATYRSLETVYF